MPCADDDLADATARWADALGSWGIPEEILAQAPESPWFHPPALFSALATSAVAHDRTPTHEAVVRATPVGGTVLDVGVGGGAASLPAAPPAARIVGVDENRHMLDEFVRLAAGVDALAVEGKWPDVAASVEVADVVVCRERRLQRRRARRLRGRADREGPAPGRARAHGRAPAVVRVVVVEALLGPRPAHDADCGRCSCGRRRSGGRRPGGATVDPSPPRGPPRRSAGDRWLRRRLCLQPSADEELARRRRGAARTTGPSKP